MASSLLDIRVGEATFGSVGVRAPWAFRIVPGAFATLYALLGGSGWLRLDNGQEYAIADGGVVSVLSGREHRLAGAQDSLSGHAQKPLDFDALAVIDFTRSVRYSGTTIIAARVPIGSNPLPDILSGAVYVPPAEQATCARLHAVLRLAAGLHEAPETVRALLAKRIAEMLAIELTEFSLHASGAVPASRDVDPRIRRAIELMRLHPERNWSLVGLAAEACMSRSSFAARFRTVVGQTPLRYLQKMRMERAIELVRDTNLPLYSVAERVGYASDTSFNKAFNREFGMSPTRYRKSGSSKRASQEPTTSL